MHFETMHQCNIHCPPGKIKRLVALHEFLIKLVAPFANARIDQRLHFLDVGEAVLNSLISPNHSQQPIIKSVPHTGPAMCFLKSACVLWDLMLNRLSV